MIVLKKNATEQDISQLISLLEKNGLGARVVEGKERTTVSMIGEGERDRDFVSRVESLQFVEEVKLVLKPYKLVSRDAHPDYNNGSLKTKVVEAGPLKIGGDYPFAIIAGPCALEDKVLTKEIAHAVKERGANGLRGGGYKPRTSPHSFQGYGEKALKWGREACDEAGLAFVTEADGVSHIGSVLEYSDMLQIGTRNMASYDLLKQIGKATMKSKHPILLKRGRGADLNEFLQAAEYLAYYGAHDNIVLCLRGIKSFETNTRATYDLGTLPDVQEETYLPVIVDPSHAAGKNKADILVKYARGAIAMGANGLIIEVHPNPVNAMVDAAQAASYEDLRRIVKFAKECPR